MALRIQSFSGAEASSYLSEIARLRIAVFREYPYLYDGSDAYEWEYLATYTQSPGSVVVVAFDGDKIIGASTGLPMEDETPNVQAPWVQNGYPVGRIFYFGESVLEQRYRGRGIGVAFFEHREAWAKTQGNFDVLTFCAVVRPENHPAKPVGYQPLNTFWEKRGFLATPFTCTMDWKEVNQAAESTHQLQFWWKKTPII
ncbi:MAG TPA: GNAT family N-acetyltransferase [Saprospiraceae bacterium]|nr:GNAT family N-acetyltransferase [Saprospiraceae bacterium]HMQ83492.1 GNAT family N-acetyltransferase [Saprospiraceae bacterium]